MERKTEIQHLTEQAERIAEMRAYLPGLVVQARYAGESWATIGQALGISKSEAYRKYAKICQPLPQSRAGRPTAD